MLNVDLKTLLIDESEILTSADKQHIENYKNLIQYFYESINNSLSDDQKSYQSLHSSTISAIKQLEQLVNSYDNKLAVAQGRNQIIHYLEEKISQQDMNDKKNIEDPE